MARLKFNRLLAVVLKNKETMTVPTDEYWIGRLYAFGAWGVKYYNATIARDSTISFAGGGKIEIHASDSNTNDCKILVSGIAFKVVND